MARGRAAADLAKGTDPDPGRGRPPFYRWFPDAELNTCENALDRHVDAGHGERLALIHDSAVTGQVRRFTYAALREQVARFAGVLRSLGVRPATGW